MYGNVRISSVREHWYLGIVFMLNGCLKNTQQKLKEKGLKSYFSLKSMVEIIIRPLKLSVVFKLFNSLVLPVASYGCQVWFAETRLVKNFKDNSPGVQLPSIAKDPIEKLHLSFLKWNLGVGRKTSNAAVWSDSGRYPLVIEISKQVFG